MITDLPAGWESSTLGELVEHQKGKVPKAFSMEPTDGLVPYIDIEAFETGLVKRYASPASMTISTQEDVLIVWDGARFGLSGVFGRGALGSTLVRLRSNALERDYLLHFIRYHFKTINSRPRGTGTPHVEPDLFWPLEIGIPPAAEQKRIVEKIESLLVQLDRGEEAVREAQNLLTRYRQSVLKSAATGQLTENWRAEKNDHTESGSDVLDRILKARRSQWEGRGKYVEPEPPNKSKLPEIPEGWIWATVDQLAKIMGGLTKNGNRQNMPLQRPMLRVANVYQNRLNLDHIHQTGVTEGELARVSLNPRDILVVEGNGSKDQIGRMAVWSGEIPSAVHQNHLIKIRLHETSLAEFLVTWFQSLLGRQVVEKVASSTSGLYTLSISKIAQMVIPLPSLEEVREIMDRVQEAHSKIAVLEEWCTTELKRSASLRQSILKEAFAGKLVDQDPSDEPARDLLARIASKSGPTNKTKSPESA